MNGQGIAGRIAILLFLLALAGPPGRAARADPFAPHARPRASMQAPASWRHPRAESVVLLGVACVCLLVLEVKVRRCSLVRERRRAAVLAKALRRGVLDSNSGGASEAAATGVALS